MEGVLRGLCIVLEREEMRELFQVELAHRFDGHGDGAARGDLSLLGVAARRVAA